MLINASKGTNFEYAILSTQSVEIQKYRIGQLDNNP